MDIPFILVNAVTVAAIYGLIAVAVSITWSSLGLINLAYGFIYHFRRLRCLACCHSCGAPVCRSVAATARYRGDRHHRGRNRRDALFA